MHIASYIIVSLVALLHLYILWLEMFAWETRGRKVFRSLPKEAFPYLKVPMANQGLYNGFLAAGLIWSLIIQDPVWQKNVALFFLACVAVAGVYGAATAAKRILYVQTVPAFLGIVSIILL